MQQATQPKESVLDLSIPLINYNAFRHFAQWGGAGGNYYTAPSNRLSRLMTTVISKGSILDLTAPSPNSSYSVEFYGPSISCGPLTSFNNSEVANFINDFSYKQGGDLVQYVGFVPRAVITNKTQLASALDGLNNTLQNTQYLETFDSVSKDHARLYIAVPSLNPGSTSYFADTTIECGLYNSSFQVDFTFNDGIQDTKIKNITRLNGVTSALAIANDCDVPSGTGGVCSATETTYIALLDALGSQLVGRIDQSHYGPISAVRTRIIDSVFMDTQELHKMQERVSKGLLSTAEAAAGPDVEPLSIANMSMADALEQVFMNCTLSLFGDSYFVYVDRPQVGNGAGSPDQRHECATHADEHRTVRTRAILPQDRSIYSPHRMPIYTNLAISSLHIALQWG